MGDHGSGNGTTTLGSNGGFQLNDNDIDKIVKALGGRQAQSKSSSSIRRPPIACLHTNILPEAHLAAWLGFTRLYSVMHAVSPADT